MLYRRTCQNAYFCEMPVHFLPDIKTYPCEWYVERFTSGNGLVSFFFARSCRYMLDALSVLVLVFALALGICTICTWKMQISSRSYPACLPVLVLCAVLSFALPGVVPALRSSGFRLAGCWRIRAGIGAVPVGPCRVSALCGVLCGYFLCLRILSSPAVMTASNLPRDELFFSRVYMVLFAIMRMRIRRIRNLLHVAVVRALRFCATRADGP